jgi:hypothetical protein
MNNLRKMKNLNSAVLGIVVITFGFLGVGCATVGADKTADAQMEMIQKQAEEQSLARLVDSPSRDVADAASSLVRQRITE